MYVCICLAINEKQIRELVATQEVKSVTDLCGISSAGSDCGSCCHKIKRIIDDELQLAESALNDFKEDVSA